jgi:hypothetical protein
VDINWELTGALPMKRLLLGVNGEKNSLLRVIENILITENEYWTHFNTYASLPIPVKKQYGL